jgi:hypothetical protein
MKSPPSVRSNLDRRVLLQNFNSKDFTDARL